MLLKLIHSDHFLCSKSPTVRNSEPGWDDYEQKPARGERLKQPAHNPLVFCSRMEVSLWMLLVLLIIIIKNMVA